MLSYLIFTLTLCAIYGLLALSLNLIWGSAGLVNLGLAGFFAVGAYASALATGAGAPVLIGWGAALLVGAAVGLVVTFATLRLRDDYLAIVTLGPGVDRIILALIIVQWATYARVSRSVALSEFGKPYIDAAHLLRLPKWRIIFRHLLPNSIAPAVTLIPIELGHAVALEATLSFLGLGVPIDKPSLGSTVANGFQYLLTGQYWISLFPGLALFGLIASINFVGEDIRRRLDPRSRPI